MDPFFADYADRLAALFAGIDEAIAGLPEAALDWSPGPEINSAAVLVAHTAGATRYWVGDVAGERPSGRVRAAEFATAGRTAADLRALLADTLADVQTDLARLTAADLPVPRRDTRSGAMTTAGWALLHALEHAGQHLGHVQINRQLWAQRGGAEGETPAP